MKQIKKLGWVVSAGLLVILGMCSTAHPAAAAVKMGTGNSSLLGGDLTDPADGAKDKPGVNYGASLPEADMRPVGGAWIAMKLAPVSPPGSAPHQTHAYQSWQGTPACKIFLNNPEKDKWYMGYKDGGRGGPTRQLPYTVAVQLKESVILTHFTITTDMSQPVLPDRDPKSWAIQGSNTGKDDDWADIYVCDPVSRAKSPFKVDPRNETTLFTSFNSASIEGRVDAESAKKLALRVKGKKFPKPDFETPSKAYRWFRIAIYSCFNPNSMTFSDFNRPPGCALAQMELFGVPVGFTFSEMKTMEDATVAAKPLKPAVSDLPFIISYWCGPPKAETTLERYKEIVDCGFNVASPAIDALWTPFSKESEEHNRKYLDLCQQAGLKALVWDDSIPKGVNWKAPATGEIPQMEKALDGMIARYSSHPALLGYVVSDEPTKDAFARLGVVNQHLLKKDPKHLPYINLSALHTFNPRTGYDEFVGKYIETVKPALVSWEHHQQIRGWPPPGAVGTLDEGTYWTNLEIIRQRCTEAGIPYNQSIVSIKYPVGDRTLRECTEADLRWQVYTSLAFGSRGIQYFTYWHAKEIATGDTAIMAKDGRPDKKYEYIKRINQRIARLGPTLTKLVCTGAYCGGEPMPPGGVELADDAPVKRIEGGRVVIGCFHDGAGKRYIFPVNRTVKFVVTTKMTLDAKVESVSEISQDTGEVMESTTLTGGGLQVQLQPGEGKLYLLNDKK